jgi:hypothetical protein
LHRRSSASCHFTKRIGASFFWNDSATEPQVAGSVLLFYQTIVHEGQPVRQVLTALLPA